MTIVRYSGTGNMSDPITLRIPTNPYARISRVAAKLGVTPGATSGYSVVMIGEDGEQYDLFEIIERIIDRMNRVA